MWEVQYDRRQPCKLVWTRFAAEGRRAERALHAYYADRRASGEWFRLTPDDVSAIVTMTDEELAGLLPLADPAVTVRVRLDIPNAEHAELRILAAQAGLSMAKFCERLVAEAIHSGRVMPAPEPPKKSRRGK